MYSNTSVCSAPALNILLSCFIMHDNSSSPPEYITYKTCHNANSFVFFILNEYSFAKC